MPNPYFSFKKFTVYHDKCAMKVGTDGCLLGAWADVKNPKNILDIGTGTGLIALMMAQRFSRSKITALEIEKTCSNQCTENVNKSPFCEQIKTVNLPLQEFTSEEKFDLIVCNPPFFTKSELPPNTKRSTARHDNSLSAQDIFAYAEIILSANGKICLVIPVDREVDFTSAAAENKLFLTQKVIVKPTPTKAPKRLLLSFGRKNSEINSSEIIVETSRGNYSEEFRKLLTDFYLYL